MTTISQDTVVRSDQSGLGTASDGSSYTVNGSLTTAIASNEAVITGSSGFLSVFLSSNTTADIEFTVRVKQTNNIFDGIGPCFRAVDANNMYFIALYGGLGGLVFAKLTGGSFGNIADANFSLSNNTFYQLHVKMIGNHLQARIWLDGTSEPGTWNIDTTDTSYASAGRFGMSFNAFAGGSDTVLFDHILVTDGSSSFSNTRTIPSTTALQATSTRTIPSTAAILQTSGRTITSTAALASVRTIPSTAVLLQTSSRTITSTAALSGAAPAPTTNVVFYVRSGNATFYVR